MVRYFSIQIAWGAPHIGVYTSTLTQAAAALPSPERSFLRLHDTGRSFYRPELDCLRFFAFFSVLVYHTLSGDPAYYAARHVPFGLLISSAASAGRFGVDLFFLLSAYLITELLLREREKTGSLDLRAFYVRRILRIWPLYFLALLIGILLPRLDPSQEFPWRYLGAFVLLSGNWIYSFGGYFQSVMMVLWSVCFEEQFYLVWPAVISRTQRRKGLLYASGVLLVVAEVSRLALLDHARTLGSEVAIFTNTLTRLDPLALGIAIAAILHKRNFSISWFTRLGLFAIGALIWLAAGHYYSLSVAYMMLGYPGVAAGALLIFLAMLGSGVSTGWLRYLGRISYGLYVFHGFALYLVYKALHGSVHNLTTFVYYWSFGLALTVAMAALSYRFFESPFLRLKERFTYVKSRPV